MIFKRCFAVAIGLLSLASLCVAQDPANRARITELARQIASKTGDQTPAITEALRICGFTIRKEDRTKIADPVDPILSTRLAITDYEISGFWELYKRGQGVNYGNFYRAYDHFLQSNGAENISIGSLLTTMLTLDPVQRLMAKQKGQPVPVEAQNQLLAGFVAELAQEHENFQDAHFGDGAFLDPIQALILSRIVSEEIAKAIKLANPGENLFASLIGGAPVEDVGWAEDGFVGGITGLINKLVEAKFGEKISKPMDKANAISSISKFILTYTFLKNDLKMEGETNLLVRTKDTAPGEKKTINARIYIDGSKVTDWLKENRKLIALAGIDVDSPKSGGLAGIETSWEIKGDGKDYDFNNHRVKWASGQGEMSKLKTNESGIAKAILEGAAQRKALDPKLVKAYEKTVYIKVTPQAKGTEMKQDVTDAVMGAIGVSGGPSGWISPVMETLYRMKWFGTETINVRVRDWKQAQSVANVTIEVKGDGATYSRDFNYIQHIYRVLEIENMVMEIGDPVDSIQTVPADILAKLPAAQRKQIEDAMKQAVEQSPGRIFSIKGPGEAGFTVRDSIYSLTNDSDCEVSINRFHCSKAGQFKLQYPDKSAEGNALNLNIMKKTDKNDEALIGAAAMLMADYKEERSGSKPASGSIPARVPVSLYDDITFDAVDRDKMKITLKPGVQLPGEEGTGFYGVTTIPFKFGPQNRFSGRVMISISIQNKAPK
ncbi:MAG TPA: hypothetical protein VK171_07810 [Fimbriimonas sp.]|nr:hypothetical protein [Fimbriimonas sp.]